VQDGGTARQLVVRSVLGDLARDAAHVRPPAVTVIGAVVAHLAENLPGRVAGVPALSSAGGMS
jgi:siroheme synthase